MKNPKNLAKKTIKYLVFCISNGMDIKTEMLKMLKCYKSKILKSPDQRIEPGSVNWNFYILVVLPRCH